MATSISAVLIPCLKSFNQLQERVEQSDYSHEREVSSVSWGDELGRLRVWAANIGAHQTGQSSLDFRLRDASHISNQITKLLQDLSHSLDDIVDELSEDRTEASEDDETSASWLDNNSTTEIQQLHEEVVNIIDCLYQLSMLIRKPAQHDLLVGSRIGDKAEFEFYDKEHVRNLHPMTEEQIIQRLGRAITRRRKYLNYRERHHRKLEKGIEELQDIQRTTTGSVMSETIATDFKTANIDFEETSSNSGVSQTSYAPSLIDGGRVTIPPPPRESVGEKPFECPYCYFVINIKNTRSWSRHIFRDIKPYVCTFTDCSVPDRLYDSRREWYSHETTEHYRKTFVCALCKDTLESSKQYERHVARHLEELAIFALPRNERDDAEDDDEVLDARAFMSANDVALDIAHSSDHSDHSSLASITYDEDSTGTSVQVRPRSPDEGPEYSDPVEEQDGSWNAVYPDEIGSLNPTSMPRLYNDPIPFIRAPRPEEARRPSFSRPVSPEPGVDGSPDIIKDRPGRTQSRQRQKVYDQDRSHSAAAAARRRAPIGIHDVQHKDTSFSFSPRDQIHGSRISSPYSDNEFERKMKKVKERYQEEKETDEEFRARWKKTIVEAGYDEESIWKIPRRRGGGKGRANEGDETKIQSSMRPTYIKVHQKHISPITLNEYNLPWEYDKYNPNYIIIKKPIEEVDQELLFNHTEQMRKSKAIIDPSANEGGETKYPGSMRPTYLKVHRKHMSRVTLNKYDLPWEYDEDDSNYIIIKKWISEVDQVILFNHTKRLREFGIDLKKEKVESSSEISK
ncbi:MAG: hypothetical protein Q9161_005328 [Pseudevernia consocians]